MASPKTRRTRIVCVSDTHNATVKLPPGDVLIHAGDLTNQGSYSEVSSESFECGFSTTDACLLQLERTMKWLENAPFEAKIVIAGTGLFPFQPSYQYIV
jgi:hypothetical protein